MMANNMANAPNVWTQMNYIPPRGQCNHKPSLLAAKCPCLRFMLHPLKVSLTFPISYPYGYSTILWSSMEPSTSDEQPGKPPSANSYSPIYNPRFQRLIFTRLERRRYQGCVVHARLMVMFTVIVEL
jgi:hypothetical protein